MSISMLIVPERVAPSAYVMSVFAKLFHIFSRNFRPSKNRNHTYTCRIDAVTYRSYKTTADRYHLAYQPVLRYQITSLVTSLL